MYEQVKEAIQGINAINVTPFDEELNIDWGSLQKNISFLLEKGLKAIYPCGNTGEFYALSKDESMEVTRFVTDFIAKRSVVIAGVGYDVKTARELAQHAESCGADGIMIHQPVHPYLLTDGLIDYYKEIAVSTTLPIVLYIRSEHISLEAIQEITKLPNVIGVKYAFNNLPHFTKIVQIIKEDIVWICGTAEMWAPFYYAAGAKGFTSGLVNVETSRSFQMLEALKDGNYPAAMSVWEEIAPFEELRAKYLNGNNVSIVKEAMSQLGLIAHSAVRPPISKINENEKHQVHELLQRWGF
ncbi:dihydrodipicolinate synthase family protein [Paenibacillus aceris]|uniref:4-hydroxy-tetrahydrodipicolinate synthase n=1 Tax=Paenibacillus aceris TaxID=869555 RepID=A0ABS4I0C3_9BACL|nr:dihydrodipicolinate synthase family protein [Paenibacillus aceris]MBP1964253.1 4-hydroxy-tetrahydrodipicolinate synthase [Paenibacillus aceris]NHW36576.1 dihydrodipicolinate synthase family protein [Paenibacillus aceris]